VNNEPGLIAVAVFIVMLCTAGAINSLRALRTARGAAEYLLLLVCLIGIWLPLFGQVAMFGEVPGVVLTKAVQLGYISVAVAAVVIVARYFRSRRQK
jgi:hypothetical protein